MESKINPNVVHNMDEMKHWHSTEEVVAAARRLGIQGIEKKSLHELTLEITEKSLGVETRLAPVGGTKHDGNKAPLHFIPLKPMEEVAHVFGFGARKYAAFNYRKGFPYSRLVSAAMRHIMQFNANQDLDEESGRSHLAHAMCCLIMLMETQQLHPNLDDRDKENKLL